MDLQTIKYDKSEGIATITLNRPEKRNPLSPRVIQELSECLTDADADKSIGALILTGGEKVFCAGMDIAEMQQFKPEDLFPIVDETGTVLETGVKVKVPAGKFEGAIVVEESSLIPDSGTEKKWYVPGVGVVRVKAKGEKLVLIASTLTAVAP